MTTKKPGVPFVILKDKEESKATCVYWDGKFTGFGTDFHELQCKCWVHEACMHLYIHSQIRILANSEFGWFNSKICTKGLQLRDIVAGVKTDKSLLEDYLLVINVSQGVGKLTDENGVELSETEGMKRIKGLFCILYRPSSIGNYSKAAKARAKHISDLGIDEKAQGYLAEL